jgi:hypothetical protein
VARLCDPLVPIEHALQLSITLPRCRVFLDPDEGHHFFRRRLSTILAMLIGKHTEAGDDVATRSQMRMRWRRAPGTPPPGRSNG